MSLRLADVEACIFAGAAWAAIAHFTAGFDRFLLLTFFLTAFFLYITRALTGKGWTALIIAFTAGLLSVHSASMAGPGTYKLLLLAGAGLIFEATYAATKRPYVGATVAAALMPLLIWLLSDAQAGAQALADTTITATLAGTAGALAGFLLWSRISYTKPVIRFQLAGTTGPKDGKLLISKRKKRNAFYKRKQ